MDIDNIINEWFYRLDKGYALPPYNNNELSVLEEVFDELNIKNKDKAISFLSEGTNIGNRKLEDKLKSTGKLKDLIKFRKDLPSGKPASVMNKYIKSLSADKIDEFIASFWSVTEIPTGIGSGVESEVFSLNATGIGIGELWLNFKIKGSKIQGQSKSFDLQTTKGKYEVKDYSGGRQPIRLGVEGNIGNFPIWDDIGDTLRIINDLDNAIDVSKYFDKAFASIIKAIKDRTSDYKKGAWSRGDQKNYQSFFDMAFEKTDIALDGYNRLDLRGPNIKPMSILIEPTSKSEVEPDLDFEKADKSENEKIISKVITELRRLKYVRSPKKLKGDIQKAIDKMIKDGEANEFIIFYPGNKIKITNEFKFDYVTQGSVRISPR